MIGIKGIDRIPAILQQYADIAVYQEFIEIAFGKDSKTWETASPALGPRGIWTDARLIIISHSKNDEMVEMSQSTLMLEHFKQLQEFVLFFPAEGAREI